MNNEINAKNLIICGIVILFGFLILNVLFPVDKTEKVKELSKQEIYSEYLIEKNNKFAEGVEEINKIQCFSKDCVVIEYYFNTIPEWSGENTFESFIQMQAVSTSKIKTNKMEGRGGVFIDGFFEGRKIYGCEAAYGEIENCEYYGQLDFLN